jgi:hypothetical protein
MIDRATILEAFSLLSDRLHERGADGEVNVVGGTAMVLAFAARQTTKDVDAVFAPAELIRECARQVARDLDLPDDWINDAVKGYLSARGEFEPKLTFPHLRVLTPTAEYMLAMKVMAARTAIEAGAGDKSDIAFLIRLIGLSTAESVMAIVGRFYDPSLVAPRSLYLVEEVVADLRDGKQQ